MTNRTTANTIVRAGYAALATIALYSAVPAAAQETRQERVSYSDLDLASEAGQATLSKRISAAVKRVCRPHGSTAGEVQAWNRCKRQSLANAQGQMTLAIAKAGGSTTGIAALTIGSSPVGKR